MTGYLMGKIGHHYEGLLIGGSLHDGLLNMGKIGPL